jgi:hypothetical protein
MISRSIQKVIIDRSKLSWSLEDWNLWVNEIINAGNDEIPDSMWNTCTTTLIFNEWVDRGVSTFVITLNQLATRAFHACRSFKIRERIARASKHAHVVRVKRTKCIEWLPLLRPLLLIHSSLSSPKTLGATTTARPPSKLPL